MRIISEKRIREFWAKHPESENVLRNWIFVVRSADWKNSPGVKATFRTADSYRKCVVFDIGGNNYRVIAMVEYSKHIVFIRAVMSHAEYDLEKWKPDCE